MENFGFARQNTSTVWSHYTPDQLSCHHFHRNLESDKARR